MGFFSSDTQEFVNSLKKQLSFSGSFPTLRVCVTEKCTFNCYYCHKEGMQNAYSHYLTLEEYLFLAKTFFDLGFRDVKFTGGEPLLCNNLPEIIKIFKQAGFVDVSLVTNASLLDEKKLSELKNSGLDRITVSLNSLKNKTANQINNSEENEKAKENIILARKFFDIVKVNSLILPNINFPDEILEIANFCRDNKLTLKILSLLSEETPYPLSNQALRVIKLYKHLVSKENSPNSFVPGNIFLFSDGTKIEINDFRSQEYRAKKFSTIYCKDCEEKSRCIEGPYAIRIMPNGDVKTCLARNDNIIKFTKIQRSPVKLICLTGLASAGKSYFSSIAKQKFGIKGVFVGQILKDELTRQNKELSYDNVIEESKRIYLERGPLGVITESFSVIEKELLNEKIIILDAVRSTTEFEFLSQFFKTYLVGVISTKKQREESAKNAEFTLRQGQLEYRDKLEMGQLNTIPKFNVGELLGCADYYISMESNEDFEKKASEIIEEIIKD